ncbi:hypothetical protein LY90DRAFT_677099 [Neocallimastix californiae]|uniref:Uncharacterized protein n=1 Tax=Neocallimastix californiae TaxID=1754190 RepID=A0A1Y2AA13_9FUNG|nr:hypothetical protein LY90DRAFT_677099 [Neocallimastix californiae]|eukprot:ORY19336.1 hypothetical protein LY90DRAFT_677099 [Neocallimastix californiae]
MIGDMNYNVDRLLRRSRIIGFFLMENNEKKAEKIREGILETIVRLETKYIPVLVKYSLDEVSDVPVIIYYNTNEGLKSSYAHYNGYELMKEIIVWSKSLYNTPSEELIRRAKNGSSIFDDYRYRMFSDNIKDRSYNNIMKETFLKIYNEANDYQNSKILVIYIFTVVIVVLSLVINIFGSLKDIVSRFEDSIESITQIYDINYDDKKKKFENVENNGSFMNYIYDMQGYLINILILFTALLIAIPIITKKYYMDKRVNFNLSTVERKEMIIDLNLYGLETIIQDMKAFVAGSPESLLNNKIIELETIQNKIYLGQLNIESTTKIKELNSLLVNNNCKLDESICESLEEIPEIDFTKNMVKLGLNELIDEYLTKSKSILNKSQIKKYKNEKYIYHYEYENNRFKNYCLNDSDFRFQYEVISHCINGLDKFYTILFDSLFENVRSTIYTTIYCSLIGLVLLSISIIISRKSIKTSNKVLREMVDLIFIIPTSTINMIFFIAQHYKVHSHSYSYLDLDLPLQITCYTTTFNDSTPIKDIIKKTKSIGLKSLPWGKTIKS